MSAPRRPAGGFGSGDENSSARVDAALRRTVALLELVRQEEALLGWLNDCVAQLRAVHLARQHLLDVTDAELAKAREVTPDVEARDQPPTSSEEVGS